MYLKINKNLFNSKLFFQQCQKIQIRQKTLGQILIWQQIPKFENIKLF